ncbi:MAG: hypothetical protein U0451_00020 [Candidatus Saccharimonadales bacterium]
MAAKESKKNVFDIAKPGSTVPSSTSKPVIISHKPLIKDSTVVEEKEGSTSETPAPKAPSEKVTSSKIIQPLTPSEPEKEAPQLDSVGTTEDSLTDEKVVEDTVEDSNESEDKSQEEAIVDAVVSQTDDKKAKKKEADEQIAHREKINKLIESKQYFVRVRQPKSKRNKKMLLLVLFVVLVGMITFGLAADAEIIDFNVPFDFIKKEQPEVVQQTGVTNIQKNDTEDPTEETKPEYVVPEGYLVYENRELGFKFAYAKEYGSIDEIQLTQGAKSKHTNTSVYSVDLNKYFESSEAPENSKTGVSGEISLSNFKSTDVTITSRRNGSDVKLENAKWINITVNPVDPAKNQVGQEYKDIEGKSLVPTNNNGLQVYDFKSADEGCTIHQLLFVVNDKLNMIKTPRFCDGTLNPSGDGKKIDDSAYNNLVNSILTSIAKTDN